MEHGAYTTVEYRFADEQKPILTLNVALAGGSVPPIPEIGEAFAIEVDGIEGRFHSGRVQSRHYTFLAPKPGSGEGESDLSDYVVKVEVVLKRTPPIERPH